MSYTYRYLLRKVCMKNLVPKILISISCLHKCVQPLGGIYENTIYIGIEWNMT